MEFLLDQWYTIQSAVISEGESHKCTRVYRNGIITLHNAGQENAGALVVWSSHEQDGNEENQFTLEIAPGASIEFEFPKGKNGQVFLDSICLDLICGDTLEISYLIPSAILN